MKTLTINNNGGLSGTYTIDKERVWIGRAPECDIQVEDPRVSSKHARIITILHNSFVEDMDSTNGTILNSQPVDKQELHDGDVISIGSLEVLYQDDEEEKEDACQEDENGGATSEEEAEVERTIVVSRQSPTLNEDADRQTRAIEEAEGEARQSIGGSEANTKKCFVKVMTGPAAGKMLQMRKPLVTLGAPGVQMAVISKRREGYFFTYVEGGDEEGKQPMVNGEPSGSEARLLKNFDIVELAGHRIQVILK